MTNVETVNFLYTNYDKYFKIMIKKIKSEFITEECIGKFTTHLLSKTDEVIQYPNSYIVTGVFNQFLNYEKTWRKYISYGDVADDKLITAVDESLCVLDKISMDKDLNLLKLAINELPTKQKLSVDNFIKYDSVYKGEGNKNTQKANFLHAVNALKGIML